MTLGEWIDISMPLTTGMITWPGDPLVRITKVSDLANGDPFNLTHLSLGAHTGTHMDAPNHYLPAGSGMETMPLETTIGQARVLEIGNPEAIEPSDLEPFGIMPGERLLFKTRNSSWSGEGRFYEDFVYITAKAAEYLVECRVRCLGVDYLSVGGFHVDGDKTHRILLSAGIWVIEGLRLESVVPGHYELVCLPLNIIGADGAPARAVIRPLTMQSPEY